ncbi:MAG: amidohydrolase family protein [Acidimicrobiales bacterium]|nr:amidohydrolase family protein [Acidimicrobiales bacterium]
MATLLRGGTLIDGTGAPARPADVLIDGGRIAAIGAPGTLHRGGVDVVDLDGLVLAPGFIDVHTHYDAQILWDGDLTPSSWHGVTTVIMGNCGFGVAPTKPEHRDTIARTLENVEGMALDALEAGIDWCFESFPEYLRAIDERPKRLNVGAFLGHTPLRLFVVGAEERPATDAEVETMRAVLREAIEAGAVGFSTSRQPAHQGAYGRPVPSRFAEVDEVGALAAVLGDLGRGVIQVSIGPGLFVDQFSDLATRHGVPVTWTALVARADTWSEDKLHRTLQLTPSGVPLVEVDERTALIRDGEAAGEGGHAWRAAGAGSVSVWLDGHQADVPDLPDLA